MRISPENAATLYALVGENGLENTQVVLTGVTPGGEFKFASRSGYRQASRGWAFSGACLAALLQLTLVKVELKPATKHGGSPPTSPSCRSCCANRRGSTAGACEDQGDRAAGRGWVVGSLRTEHHDQLKGRRRANAGKAPTKQ